MRDTSLIASPHGRLVVGNPVTASRPDTTARPAGSDDGPWETFLASPVAYPVTLAASAKRTTRLRPDARLRRIRGFVGTIRRTDGGDAGQPDIEYRVDMRFSYLGRKETLLGQWMPFCNLVGTARWPAWLVRPIVLDPRQGFEFELINREAFEVEVFLTPLMQRRQA